MRTVVGQVCQLLHEQSQLEVEPANRMGYINGRPDRRFREVKLHDRLNGVNGPKTLDILGNIETHFGKPIIKLRDHSSPLR